VNSVLSQGQTINGKYTVVFFLKRGSYAETYRVKDNYNNIKLLKLFVYSKLHRTQFDANAEIVEIEILKKLNHPNIVKFHDSGDVVIDNQKFAFAILDFISGETLSDKMKREQNLNPYEAKDIISGVLNGLNYLHNQSDPIIHNDITNLNVMLDLSNKIPVPKIIDFGYARLQSQSNKDFNKIGLNPFYTAGEKFNLVFSIQGDIFSVGALYYHLLFGITPWFFEMSKYKSDELLIEDQILSERRKPLKVLQSNNKISPETIEIISKALHFQPENRFQSTNEFIKALNGEFLFENSIISEDTNTKSPNNITKKGDGFKSIAGMQDLKDTLKLDVIDALIEKDRYREYGLTIPNGMLLYGPPGCGKTFFAEKLAEEIGFHFYQIKPSDIQSKWVNASQENIKNLFDEARKNAPSIVFIDELDALVPNRDDSGVNHMNTSAVNEFLAQMNNIGAEGVFVIGATNRPNAIDPAILRAGRLDKHIYIPPPDFEARELMFKLYLQHRPIEIGLNYQQFATATEFYVSSDIKFLCDEASRMALKAKTRITAEMILKSIEVKRPSLSRGELQRYTDIQSQLNGNTENTNKPNKIGF
jgi:transitional endoplasmic reticulum ATPase